MSAWYNKTMAFPGELNINYYKGDTHEFKVYPQKTDGSIFNLNDYSNATFTIATERGSNPTGTTLMPTGKIFGHASIDGDGTYITCAITPENGEDMESNITYVYDVQIYAPGSSTYDKIFTLLTGSISVTDDVTQYIGTPNRSIPTYRVIYHNTNATFGEPPVDNVAYFPTSTFEVKGLENLARTGYYLSGWNTASDGNGISYEVGQQVSSFNADVRLYPKWVVNTVVYDNQSATTNHIGGSTTYTPLSAIETIPTTPPVRTGYVFSGWFTGPAGSGVEVTDGSHTPLFPWGPVILYAKWIPVYSVFYDDQSATTTYSGGSTSYVSGQAIEEIPTIDPIRTGYVFSGWFTGPAGSGTQVTNGSYTPNSPYVDITLYAKWEDES
jgi:uncharacterized repeat protein (TIGR02543 family)